MHFLVFGNNLSGFVPASLTECKMLNLLLVSKNSSDPTTRCNPDLKCTRATLNAIMEALPDYNPQNFALPAIVC